MKRYMEAVIVLVLVAIAAGCKPPSHESSAWVHPLEGSAEKFHGAVFAAAKNSACSLCHGKDLLGRSIGTSEAPGCDTCHFGPSGSRVPAGSTWTHGFADHGSQVSFGQVCEACHQIHQALGLPPACHSCHAGNGSSMHELGQPWLDPASAGYHGKSSLNCSLCHNLETECATCHFGADGSKSPSGSGWTHGAVPHASLTPYEQVCSACHDLLRGYGSGPASCHDCHSHEQGQAWLDRNSSQFHGSSTLDCSSCHDLNTTCQTCHFGADGAKSPPDSGWTHGTMPHESLEASGAVCNQCHTLDRSYGYGPDACHDCHEPHPAPFDEHGATAKQDLVYCAQCHASPPGAGPGDNPRFNVARGSLAQGCESSGCHAAETAHPVPWKGAYAVSHQSAGNMENACALCHGASLEGGSGPACSTCHTAGSPLEGEACSSCHGRPPGTNAHDAHNVLPEVDNICSTCHSGAGSGTDSHDNGTVEVAIEGYLAKNALITAYSATGMTCSGISCHGGGVTPRWDTGSITVETDCTRCHSCSNSQYNSYRSGDHPKHINSVGAGCAECHDTAKLAAVHFNDLATPEMNEASETIRDDLNYDGSSCLFTCHLESKEHTREMTW